MAPPNTDPSEEQPSAQQDMPARVQHLEDQVKGLMETVTAMHALLMMDRRGVTKPDHYVPAASKPKSTDQSETLTQALDQASQLAVYKARVMAARGLGPAAPAPKAIDISRAGPFAYSPLRPDSLEIRVLALHASSYESAPIQCSISVVDLAKLPAHSLASTSKVHFAPEYYTPLSYTWGTAPPNQTIYVDGQKFFITHSLMTALRHFRRLNDNLPKRVFGRAQAPPTQTFWWIDAICINQGDLDEKKVQVGLMTRLYRSAILVHVWLGEEAEGSSTAMRILRELGYKPQTMQEINSWRYIRQPGQTHRPDGPGRDPVELPKEWVAGSSEEKRENLGKVVKLLKRPWFDRVWIRQEVALPWGVKFHCGEEQCSWDEFMGAVHVLNHIVKLNGVKNLREEALLERESTSSTCFETIATLDEMRGVTGRTQSYIPFKDLVFLTRNCASTDPRDKIYAMLPMINPDESSVTPDYRQHPSAAFEAAVTPLIGRSLDFLAACQPGLHSISSPSWVPDFAASWEALPPWLHISREVPAKGFQAGPPEATYDAANHTLSVSSIILDDIDIFDAHIAERTHSDEHLETLINVWWAFSQDRRAELIKAASGPETSRDAYPFINSCYDKSVWDLICLDDDWDERSRKSDKYTAAYEPERGRMITEDPAFRRAMNLLIEEFSPPATEVNSRGKPKARNFEHLRRLALGRRLAMSRGGLTCLVPKGTRKGDSVVYIKGSKSMYVLRRSENDWLMVGETYMLCQPSYEYAKDKSYDPQTIRLI